MSHESVSRRAVLVVVVFVVAVPRRRRRFPPSQGDLVPHLVGQLYCHRRREYDERLGDGEHELEVDAAEEEAGDSAERAPDVHLAHAAGELAADKGVQGVLCT